LLEQTPRGVSPGSRSSSDDLDPPRAAAFEQLVWIDLVAPAEEVGLGVVLGGPIHSCTRHRLGGFTTALELLEPTLSLPRPRALHVAPRHRASRPSLH